MKNKILSLLLLIVLVVVGCKEEQEKEVVKIGVIQSLTGAGALWGQNGKNGIELAFDEINARDNKYKYELIFENSETNTSRAVSAFSKLVNTNNIKYCIVDVISSDVLAIAPQANKNKVLIISPGASNPNITTAGDYVFRNWPSDLLQGKEQAKATDSILKWEEVAILRINNDYGVGLEAAYKDNINNAKIVGVESYEKGNTDFRTQLFKIKDMNPDGVYLLAYPEELLTILKQAQEIGFNKPFLGTETFESNELLDKAGEMVNGLIYTFPKSPDTTRSIVKEFRENYLKKYKKPFGTPADVAYDALHMLVDMIEENDNDSDMVKEALYQVKNYYGASGEYSIDSNGDAIKSFELKMIVDGKFTKL